ncbi:MAG: DeoR/GlpR family DNA-binding transcription regulator [Bacteroidales bacterium]|nr:DeoR/GlpR family DNA-binding transcription regulator [Bacteroidales bacterium]
MISANQRRDIILARVNKSGYMQVNELAALLDVTTATIRADLSIMERDGLLRRVHGSAMSKNNLAVERSTSDKSLIMSDQKRRIATLAVQHIKEDEVLFIAAGSTVAAFCEQLPADKHLTIFTPSIQIAAMLSPNPNYTVHLLGGVVHHQSQSVRGEYSSEVLDTLRGVTLVFGADGIGKDGYVMCSTVEEALFTKKVIRCANRLILLSDSSKLGRCGAGCICSLDNVDLFVSDTGLSKPDRKILSAFKAELLLA